MSRSRPIQTSRRRQLDGKAGRCEYVRGGGGWVGSARCTVRAVLVPNVGNGRDEDGEGRHTARQPVVDKLRVERGLRFVHSVIFDFFAVAHDGARGRYKHAVGRAKYSIHVETASVSRRLKRDPRAISAVVE